MRDTGFRLERERGVHVHRGRVERLRDAAHGVPVEAVAPRLTGSAMGYNMLGVHIGGFIGPVMFGAAMDAFGGDYTAGWLVTAAVTALGVLLLIFAFREGRHPL